MTRDDDGPARPSAPEMEREVVLLHYLEGYSSREIARIVRAPAGTIRCRLMTARERLRRELGERDLAYLNEPSVPMRQWAWLPLHQMYALETRLSVSGVGRGASGVGVSASNPNAPPMTPNAPSMASKEESMERREFLRQAAVSAAALALPETEKEVVDSRLTQKVICAFKGVALSDLCDQLRSDTGIQVTAGPSVADEKVTLFCEKLPLREVMRQLSRPFGYTWLRSGTAGQYRYELVQDLRSQLLEEELRNRDRHAALLSLEAEMERFRPYLDLSPDELLARARTASPAEKKLLEQMGGGEKPRTTRGWGPVQRYFRLTAEEKRALLAGERLYYSEGPREGERLLPADIGSGVIQGWRWDRFVKVGDGYVPRRSDDPDGIPLAAVPGAKAATGLWLEQGDLGQYEIQGLTGWYMDCGSVIELGVTYATGRSPRTVHPENARVNARLAQDTSLLPRITVTPVPAARFPISGRETARSPATDSGKDGETKVTTADVLEALHRATGLPVVADYYTRLFERESVSVHEQPTFAALNQLGDAMRLRWARDGGWLQFRSTSYYDDRLKEAPNRLLERWAAARAQSGFLTLDELVEIAQLPDAQLQGADMAEGARKCFGLAEWDLSRNQHVLPHLRYLAGFTPEQRREAMSEAGLPLAKMSLAQQQGFLAQVFPPVWPFTGMVMRYSVSLQSPDELSGATLWVDYTQPGWYEWRPPGPLHLRWLVALDPGPEGRVVPRPRVRERTREAALAALRRVDPQIRAAVQAAAGRDDSRLLQDPPPDEAQIVPTDLNLWIIYLPDTHNQYGCQSQSKDVRHRCGFW